MSPNVPREDLNNAPPRSLLATVTIALLILLALYGAVQLIQSMRFDDSDPDRPPIIISSGSVLVKSGGAWIDEGNKGYKQDIKGKTVKSFLAVTGSGDSECTVQGKTIVVLYGGREITISRKFKFSNLKSDAFAQFPGDAVVNPGGAGELVVTTNDAVVSFKDEDDNTCNVVGQSLRIYQLH